MDGNETTLTGKAIISIKNWKGLQARKIHFHFWSSEDDKDSKSGRPQLFVVVLKCISLAKQ